MGLCVQTNGATIVTDRYLAARFLERWQVLRDARKVRPLDAPPPTTRIGSARVTAWFTPARRRIDLADVERRLARARQGILFAMPFATKGSALAPELVMRHTAVYLRGVVTTGQPSRSGITLVDGDRSPVIIDRAALRSSVPRWSKELGLLNEFQSRIVVIDPFSDSSTVLMGSHNLTPTGSARNDETLLIVENAPAFAAAHAVRVMALYQHYSARGAKLRSTRGAPRLRSDDRWQDRLLTEHGQRELDFWLGSQG
jgi:phosphatidylserine/phosphatidylglycerophosphate/cardiolipin synthase-like enzyme